LKHIHTARGIDKLKSTRCSIHNILLHSESIPKRRKKQKMTSNSSKNRLTSETQNRSKSYGHLKKKRLSMKNIPLKEQLEEFKTFNETNHYIDENK